MARQEPGVRNGRYTPETTSRRSIMADDRDGVVERETVVVERGSAGGVIAAIALLIAVVAVLAYFGLLPI
jgi:hypothetical protein